MQSCFGQNIERRAWLVFLLAGLLVAFAAPGFAQVPQDIDITWNVDQFGDLSLSFYPGTTYPTDYRLHILNTTTGVEHSEFAAPEVSITWPDFDASHLYEIWIEGLDASGQVLETSPTEAINSDTMGGGPLNDPQPATLSAYFETLNPDLCPLIYGNVTVDGLGQGIVLDPSQFTVYEDGRVQTDLLQITPPGDSGGNRLVDIVFVVDNSGSMGDEHQAVKSNLAAFANGLEQRGINFRIGLVRFGQSSGSGNPILVNGAGMASTATDFNSNYLNQLTHSGSREPGLASILAACRNYAFRPGSQRHFLLITDEDSDGGSLSEAISCCLSADIEVHAAVRCSYRSSNSHYCNATSIRGATGGIQFSVAGPYGEIFNRIADEVGNTYVVRYRTDNPCANGGTREVTVVVDNQGDTTTAVDYYTPGTAPRITLTAATRDLMQNQQFDNIAMEITAEITDAVAPTVASARLFYKTTGDLYFKSIAMSAQGAEVWGATIPAADVLAPGLDFYVQASDGQSTVTSPGVDAGVRPHQIAVRPNYAPAISHTPLPASQPDTELLVQAGVFDDTDSVDEVTLLYREYGDLLYTEVPMLPSGGTYSATIPASVVTLNGVQYEIRAVDNLGVGSVSGPHLVTIVTGPQCLTYGSLEVCADFVNQLDTNTLLLSGNVNINDIVFFTGDITIDERVLEVSGNCGVYLRDIPTPLGTVDYTVHEGEFGFTLLGPEGDLTGFINDQANSVLALGGMVLDIETIELILDRQGVLIVGEMILPPLLKGTRLDVDMLEITRADGVQFIGCLDNIPAVKLPGNVGLSDVVLCYDSVNDCFSGHAVAAVKVVEIEGDATVCSGRLERIALAIDISPGVPIASTGFSLTGGSGLVDNLGGGNVLIRLAVDISGGPQVGGEYVVAFEDLGLTIQYPQFIEGSGNLVVFGQDTATGSIWYGNRTGRNTFGVDGHVDFVNVLIIDTEARINSEEFWGSAQGTLRVPELEGFPFNLISALFSLPYDIGGAQASINTDRIEGSAYLDLPWPARDLTFAHRVEFKPELAIHIGTNFDNLVEIPIVLASAEGSADLSEHYFQVPHETPLIVVSVKGQSAAPPMAVIAPNGERFDANNTTALEAGRLVYVADMDQATSFAVIAHPLQGTWIVDPGTSEPVTVEMHRQNPEPTVLVRVEDLGASFRIVTDVSTPLPGTLDLFFDEDGTGYDGEIIATDIATSAGTNVFTWTPQEVDSGEYFIHARFSNGKSAPVHDYSDQAYVISNPNAPATPQNLSSSTQNDTVELAWDPVVGAEGYAVYFRRAGENRFSDVRSLFTNNGAALADIVPGHSYEVAVRAYGENGYWSAFSDVISVQLIAVNTNNAPQIESATPVRVRYGEDLNYAVQASDPDGDPLEYSLENALPGMSISAGGLVSWIPTPGQTLSPRPVIRVVDGQGGSDTQVLSTLVVSESYGAAALSWDRRIYDGTGSPAWVTLVDQDLEPTVPLLVSVSCEATGAGLDLELVETSEGSGRFVGEVRFSTDGPSPDQLHVTEGTQIKVRYYDETTATWNEATTLWVASLPIGGSLDIDPDTLNQGSRGQFVTVYYEPPAPYVPEMVDISRVRLEGVLQPIAGRENITDSDGDGVMELAMKFDRAEFQAIVSAGEEVELSMSGAMYSPLATLPVLIGDVIRVIHPQILQPASGTILTPGQSVDVSWALPEFEGVDHVVVSVSLDNGTTWTQLVNVPVSVSTCTWDVPPASASSSLIMVDVYGSDGLIGTTSAGPFVISAATDVDTPEVFDLGITRIAPNPFNPMTTIEYTVATPGRVKLRIYDLAGRLVRTLVDADSPQGRHRAIWRGDDNSGARVSSGAYIVSIDDGERIRTARALLLK